VTPGAGEMLARATRFLVSIPVVAQTHGLVPAAALVTLAALINALAKGHNTALFMSYLVLARKWRPKNFTETVGQEHVLKALTNALASERLHHAYLFAGTRGVGKTTIARTFAKALNCESGITADPCGKCSACIEIDEGRFVDLIEVDAASRTKVDDTRELLDNVQYAPARGRFKVYLIDEVHMLSRNSFNALLKTLEEPPPHVKFLLATTDPQKLPVTVLSRCLQFNLKRLTPKLIKDRLEFICEAEKVDAESSALSMIARAADGSLRDALSLLDQAIAYCGGGVDEQAVGVMLGTIDRQHVSRLLRFLSAADAVGLMSCVDEIDEQFPDYARMLDDLARALQRIAVFQVIGATDVADEIEEAEIAELAGLIAAEDVQLFYQTAILGRRDIHLAPDPRSGAEMTLLRMLAFQPERSPPAAGGAPKRATASVSTAAVEIKLAETSPSGSQAVTDDQQSGWQDPDWGALVSQLEITGANRLLAINCAYLRREGRVLFLSLDARSESILTRSRQSALAQALTRHFGEPLTLDISLQETVGEPQVATPHQEDIREQDARLDAARQSLDSDPGVLALKSMFGARLKPGTVELVEQQNTPDQE
jgi:DNA polymerase III subunit gamma/tau